MPVPAREWETARLIARPAVVADARPIFERYASDPDVARFMTWTPHQDLEETVGFLRRCETAWAEGAAFPWTLWAKDDGSLAGILEIRVRSNSVDLGYALVQRRWRQGLMSEALQSVIAWALAQPQIYRVWATCDVDNIASARVLERVGMQREGVLRRWLVHPNISREPRDAFCYAIVKGS